MITETWEEFQLWMDKYFEELKQLNNIYE